MTPQAFQRFTEIFWKKLDVVITHNRKLTKIDLVGHAHLEDVALAMAVAFAETADAPKKKKRK